MKKFLLLLALLVLLCAGAVAWRALLADADPVNTPDEDRSLRFAVAADYPPFEYWVSGKLVGFDIELGRLIAKDMGQLENFQDMQFSALLPAVKSGLVDGAISTLTATPQRKQNFDFSNSYYVEELALLFDSRTPLLSNDSLKEKTLICQLGSTMETWLKTQNQSQALGMKVVTVDDNLQAVEALKAGHVEGALVDAFQARAFAKKNPQLSYRMLGPADLGYAIALKKGSPLLPKINQALARLESSGAILALHQKYLEGFEKK